MNELNKLECLSLKAVPVYCNATHLLVWSIRKLQRKWSVLNKKVTLYKFARKFMFSMLQQADLSYLSYDCFTYSYLRILNLPPGKSH
jgi:hypothetical protein